MSTKKDLELESELILQEPERFMVLLLNDDYTPMDFVVQILEEIFHKNHNEAERIMLDVHRKNRGLCGIYTYEIAETKVAQVIERARAEGYPLKAVLEEQT